jgi:hypothetical protein
MTERHRTPKAQTIRCHLCQQLIAMNYLSTHLYFCAREHGEKTAKNWGDPSSATPWGSSWTRPDLPAEVQP